MTQPSSSESTNGKTPPVGKFTLKDEKTGKVLPIRELTPQELDRYYLDVSVQREQAQAAMAQAFDRVVNLQRGCAVIEYEIERRASQVVLRLP